MYGLPAVFNNVAQDIMSTGFAEKYAINYAVLDEKWMISAMFSEEKWAVVFWDSVAAVVVKRVPENMPLIDRYELKYYKPLSNTATLRKIENEPKVLPALVREIAQCLSFTRDTASAFRLGRLVLKLQSGIAQEKALSYLEAAMKYNPKNPGLLTAKGQILYRQDRRSDASNVLKRAVMLKGAPAVAHTTLGFIAYDEGRYQDAETAFVQALRVNTKEPNAYYGRALAREKQDLITKAADDWRSYLELVPKGPWADKARNRLRRLEQRQ
jgi:tetratricopeptide (TPR) repeat protein